MRRRESAIEGYGVNEEKDRAERIRQSQIRPPKGGTGQISPQQPLGASIPDTTTPGELLSWILKKLGFK